MKTVEQKVIVVSGHEDTHERDIEKRMETLNLAGPTWLIMQVTTAKAAYGHTPVTTVLVLEKAEQDQPSEFKVNGMP